MLREHVGTFESQTSDLMFSVYEVNEKPELWVRIGGATMQVPIEQLEEIIEMFQLIQEQLQDDDE